LTNFTIFMKWWMHGMTMRSRTFHGWANFLDESIMENTYKYYCWGVYACSKEARSI
jgi:hypothetical protein